MDPLLAGAAAAFAPASLAMIVIGTVVGVIVGVLPGLGSVVGITMVLPFTYGMPQTAALALMLGVFCGSCYGGSITAILLNTPGTPQAAATALDGFPMAMRGEADLAIGWVTAASTLGGLFSVLVLILAAPQLAAFSLQFTPIEYFALGVFSLTCIVNVSREAMAKGLLAGMAGLFVATVGTDPVTGDLRFTFDVFELSAGIELVPAIVGLFAFSEMFVRAAAGFSVGDGARPRAGFRLPPLGAWRPRLGILLRSCAIGSFVGALPGTGAATAAFIAYSEAKRVSPRRALMGRGEPDGLISCESANNAVTGSALVPTLALGVPGDPVTAVMLGALIIQGVAPGPQLFVDQMPLVYGIFFVLVLCNLVMFATGALGAPLFTRLLRIPEPLLIALVMTVTLVGAYGVRGNMLDVWVALGAGVVGAILRATGFPIAPLVIGMVLSPMIEQSLRQGLVLTRGSVLGFFERPIAVALFALTAAVFLWPVLRAVRGRRRGAGAAADGAR
ncbi:tripartite tricarboxylate transporter permease [Azospirillum sp. ST 5-10]|uniref:tripartite tricarboxylate transporter permease n=1 Tax=unclassified Azospirillum TaxID=2630922 RepID=UPI003F4A29C4